MITPAGTNKIILFVTKEKQSSSTQYVDYIKDNNLYSNNIIKNSNFTTTTKTRIISKKKHILRLDKENIKSYNNKLQLEKLFLNTIKNKKINLIIFQDYNKGFLTNQNIKSMIKIACKNKIFISVDPKNKNFFSYNNINLFKPNLHEVNHSMQTKIKSSELNKLKKIICKLDKKIKSQHIITTIGGNGIFYTDKNKIYHSKPYKIKLIDPSGAGDVIITIISLLIKIEFDIHKTMKIANKCGSIVCQKTGVYALKKADFKKSLEKI